MRSKEFSELAQGPPYYQLVDGELILNPTPTLYHQSIRGILGSRLSLACGKRHERGEAMGLIMDVFLDDLNVLEPDVWYVSRAKWHILQDWVRGVPDFVAEILSPVTAELDLGRKRKIYQDFKLDEFWYIYPDRREVEIVRRSGDSYISTFYADPQYCLSLSYLPDFSLTLAELFDDEV